MIQMIDSTIFFKAAFMLQLEKMIYAENNADI